MPDVLSGLIRVQVVCKGYQQTTLVSKLEGWREIANRGYILTHTYKAKCFRNVTLINIRGLAVIIVPFRGYCRLSPNQVMIKRE